jgi:hypothetical protein
MSEVIMSESETDASPKSRYFYRDPLEAAYMAIAHGMDYEQPLIYGTRTETTSDDEGNITGRKCVGMLEWPWEESERRFYLRETSLPLLMPRIGDLAEICIPEGDDGLLECAYEKVTDGTKWSAREVIQRDGKPFFWPEREAV